jgi:hypothetical protein
MQRVSGAEPQYLRIVHKRKGLYAIAVDVRQEEDGNYSFVEYVFDHLPSLDEIRQSVNAFYNHETDQAILSGFSFEGNPVWLSSENQFNFKAAFDLAVQTEGASLPVTFKFGTDASPVYRRFDTVQDIRTFYTGALAYIQSCLEAGWAKKDSVDYTKYVLSGEEE